MNQRQSPYTVIDDVQYVVREKYDEVLGSYLDRIKRMPNVVSIYQLGNISVPGISDIDLIIVLHDEFTEPVNFRQLQRDATGDIGAYLFSHAPYVANRDTFADLSMLFFADNLRHVWGEALALKTYPAEQVEFYKYVIALEAAISQSFAFVRATHNRTIFNLRSLLCNLNAVKHNFTTLAPWRSANQRDTWRQYREDIDALRNKWFQEDTATRIQRAVDLSGRATVILGETLDELLLIGREKGYLRHMEHDVLFSLLDVNVLLRFMDTAETSVTAHANPAKILLRFPVLGPMAARNRRIREALYDVSILTLPRDLFSVIGTWFDGKQELAHTICRRVLSPRSLSEGICVAHVCPWLQARENRLNNYFHFMRGSSASGYLALTPAFWHYSRWTTFNKLKMAWNRLLVRRAV